MFSSWWSKRYFIHIHIHIHLPERKKFYEKPLSHGEYKHAFGLWNTFLLELRTILLFIRRIWWFFYYLLSFKTSCHNNYGVDICYCVNVRGLSCDVVFLLKSECEPYANNIHVNDDNEQKKIFDAFRYKQLECRENVKVSTST